MISSTFDEMKKSSEARFPTFQEYYKISQTVFETILNEKIVKLLTFKDYERQPT